MGVRRTIIAGFWSALPRRLTQFIVPAGFEHGTAAVIHALCDELEEGGGQAASDVPGLAKVVPRCRVAVAAADPPSNPPVPTDDPT